MRRTPDGAKTIVFPDSRTSTMDVCALGRKRHHVQALLEYDVTEARALFREIRKQTGQSLSFTAWLIKCIALAVNDYKEAAAYLKNRRSMLVYDSVDVSLTVERSVNGYRVPLPCVIRGAQNKSIPAIHREICAARQAVTGEDTVVLGQDYGRLMMRVFYALPGPVRRWVWRTFILKPRRAHALMGSVMVTSVGVAGGAGWFIPTSIHPLCVAVGSITKKPGVKGSAIEVREYLRLTVLIDHDVMDGMPAARFLLRLGRLLEGAHGLWDIGFSDDRATEKA